MNGVVHVVGAGLAGLSTAVDLAGQGQQVCLYEANRFAGGRCRTFWDPRLERSVDNGNHLLLSGNSSAAEYIDRIGARSQFVTAPKATFPFADLASDARWAVSMNNGPVPWWIVSGRRRIPGTVAGDYLRGLGLAFAGEGRTVSQALRDRGPIWQRFWEPLTLAVLNTTPERGAAPLLWRVMKETFAKGARYCLPMRAPKGLGTALIDPALAMLDRHGTQLRAEHALSALETAGDHVTMLRFANGRAVDVNQNDRVVLALPPSRLRSILPQCVLPRDDAAILNAHFVIEDAASLAGKAPITGVVGAQTHWIFIRGDVISLTISAADRQGVMDQSPDDLLPALWAETCKALDLGEARYRAGRINKERRATFDQSPGEVAKRAHARTPFTNLFLAGDATQTGLPATIEGAIRSGETAARLAA